MCQDGIVRILVWILQAESFVISTAQAFGESILVDHKEIGYFILPDSNVRCLRDWHLQGDFQLWAIDDFKMYDFELAGEEGDNTVDIRAVGRTMLHFMVRLNFVPNDVDSEDSRMGDHEPRVDGQESRCSKRQKLWASSYLLFQYPLWFLPCGQDMIARKSLLILQSGLACVGGKKAYRNEGDFQHWHDLR
jgi:hypothetical protein